MVQLEHWTHVIQNLANAIANHRLRVAVVMNVKMVHSIWSVAIYSVARIVDATLVDRCMARVIKKLANVNVTLVLQAAHVRKQLRRIISQRCTRINLNSKMDIHRPVHMSAMNSMNQRSPASVNVAMPNSRSCKVK